MVASNNKVMATLILTALGTSAITLPFGSESLIPLANHPYTYKDSAVVDWASNLPATSGDIDIVNSKSGYSDRYKYQTILEFSKQIINNSKDLDGEYVDFVNEHFWDLN